MSTRALDDPVLEERRLAALSQIRQLGDPGLRTPADSIAVFDDALSAEVARMAVLIRDARGVGLAAPQIGSLRRLVVIQPSDEEPPLALCNPRIVRRSDEEETDVEGCLSIGEITVEVPRASEISIEAQDVSGNPIALDAAGFPARVIQHELDHLDGVLILDRATPEQRREALRALRAAP